MAASAAEAIVVVRPGDLVFNTTENGSCGAPQSVAITSVSGGGVGWQVQSSAPWLHVSQEAGLTPSELTSTADCAGMAPGVYNATLTVSDAGGFGDSVVTNARLIVNPASRVTLSPWKDGARGAFSVSTDDGYPAGYTELLANGFTGTFVMNGTVPPPYYADMFSRGMELGAHLVSHYCHALDEPTLRAEIEMNMAGVVLATQSYDEVVSLIWPCGFTNLESQAIAAEYFLSARGYNINDLEEQTPANLMNLRSFNSHEHEPFPPEDLKAIVDAAEAQGMWANLVLHAFTNDDAAISYARTRDVWVAPIGTVIKYTLQRDRTIITQYSETSTTIGFRFSRFPLAPTVRRDFETTIKPTDEITFRVDVTDIAFVSDVTVSGETVPFEVRTEGASSFLYFSSPVGVSERVAEIAISDIVPPILGVSSPGLVFTANVGENPDDASFHILNAGSGVLTWTASVQGGGPSWLTLSPASGVGSLPVTVSVNTTGLTEGSYSRWITIDAPGAFNGPITVPVMLFVNPAGAQSYALNYPDRNRLLAAGWDFQAQPAGGGARNTEYQGIPAIVYDTVRSLRIPADVGDLWEGQNDTRNSLFRDLPSDWTSVRVRLDFAPAQNYQQAGLVVYGNDDTYVQVTRSFVNGHYIAYLREAGGVAGVVDQDPVTATTNMVLRLDRNPASNVISGLYSLDGGTTWHALGSVTQSIGNPRLGLITGATVSDGGGVIIPDATYHVVQVIAGGGDPEPPVVPGGVMSLSHPDRASLHAAGWDFLARTAGGAVRPTERTSGAVVAYSATGPLRIPADVGDLWEGQNNTRNSLFRDLPSNWTSVRVLLDFAPTQNYQQAGLVVYQNDDTYVQVTRDFNGGQYIAFVREAGGTAAVLSSPSVTATTNMLLRLDRNPATNVITGLYSLNGGTSWLTLGSITQALSNPRLGLIVTASPGGFPQAALHYVQVLTAEAPTTPVLTLGSTNLSFAATQGGSVAPQTISVSNTGGGALNWTVSTQGGAGWLAVSPTSGTGPGVIQVSANIAGLPVGTYNQTITVAASGATGSPQTVNVQLVVMPATGGDASSYPMNYANAASIKAAGWDFLARTASGGVRATEQTSGAVVAYSATGPLRIPADIGDLWQGQNNTRNSLFRDLPSNWTSVRVLLDFAPTQNYQQAGLVVYQNDDTYVQVTRDFNGGQYIAFVREAGGNAAVLADAPVSATTNMLLRLDRAPGTNVITGSYSLNGGVSWLTLGSVTQALSNPRLGLIVTASPGGFPQAAIHLVQVHTDNTPTLTVGSTALNLSVNEGGTVPNQTISIGTGGAALAWTATVSQATGPNWLGVSPAGGSGAGTLDVSVNASGLAPGSYTRSIVVEAPGAADSPRTVNVTLVVAQNGTAHYALNYPDRAGLLAAGWNFLARSPSGSNRNTEQVSGATVSYGTLGGLLIPADVGDLWQGLNNTRNSLFRDLPFNWTSVRVLLDFAPTQNYQQAGLVVYQNDDTYVQVMRDFDGRQQIAFVRETGGNAAVLSSAPVTATTNMLLRLDRNPATNVITGLYSLNGGTSWQTLGSVTQALSNPRLGLIVTASPGGFPAAVLRSAEVWVQ